MLHSASASLSTQNVGRNYQYFAISAPFGGGRAASWSVVSTVVGVANLRDPKILVSDSIDTGGLKWQCFVTCHLS